MSVNYVSSRQKHWIWSQKNLLRPPSWKEDNEVTKKKVRVIDRDYYTRIKGFLLLLISETLVLYRQSEKNCSLETYQDNLSRLEHSIQRTFSAVSLVPPSFKVELCNCFLYEIIVSLLLGLHHMKSSTTVDDDNHIHLTRFYPAVTMDEVLCEVQGLVWYKDK